MLVMGCGATAAATAGEENGGDAANEGGGKAVAKRKKGNEGEMLGETRLAMTSRTAFFNGESGIPFGFSRDVFRTGKTYSTSRPPRWRRSDHFAFDGERGLGSFSVPIPTKSPVLSRSPPHDSQCRAMALLYVGPRNAPDLHSDYHLSPIFTPSHLLAQFPPVYMSCGERDPLVDDVSSFNLSVREFPR